MTPSEFEKLYSGRKLLVVDTKIVTIYGFEAAAILACIGFHPGKWFALKWLAEEFNYINLNKLKKTLKELIQEELLTAEKPNKNKGDQTLWYTINLERYHNLLPTKAPAFNLIKL